MMKIKNIIGRWQLRRLKQSMQPSERSFPADLLGTKHILVCLPGHLRELTLVKQFLPTISTLFKSASVTLLTVPGNKVHDIYPRRGFQILTPSTDQLTWSGLPRRSYIATLKDFKFDLLLDLNLESTYFTSAILLHFPEAIRIGRGNHLGSPFYNLEIKTKYLRDERNIYRSLLDTLKDILQSAGEKPAITGQ